MIFKPRYRLRYFILVFGILAVFCLSFKAANGELSPALPIGEALKYVFRFCYMVAFFFCALNLYYRHVVGRFGILRFWKLTALMILAVLFYHSLLYAVFPAGLFQSFDDLPSLLCSCMQEVIPMLIFSFLFAYVTNIREALVQRRVLQAQKLQLEIENVQANFNFLKAQINPHFLHNTLNFLYAKSLPHAPELSEGILTLSDIMRYALQAGDKQDGLAMLSDEIEHVHNVIKINQLRYDNRLQVRFEVKGNTERVRIVPFVLITLIENAFKHGDLKNPLHPLDIYLEVGGNRLVFTCRNRKKAGPKASSTGIGLDNIKKRLDLSYGDCYQLDVKEDDADYAVELIISDLSLNPAAL